MQFKHSEALTLGVELELQIVDRHDADLTRGAGELIALLRRIGHPGEAKPEITQSMIEICTGIHASHATLRRELIGLRTAVCTAADRLNLLICGGGTHPFQRWDERRIYDRPRYRQVSELYGYLAKQFTVFGQHVHVGCASADDALYLLHALARYVPHFVALAASSPFHQGVDTLFQSSRLNAVAAFPLSGRAPLLLDWEAFHDYVERMRAYGIVESMKDFYWDIRPKPEFGTVEIRVFDTPLTVERAADLAAYAQAICRHLLRRRGEINESIYDVYSYNRFQACRFGLHGELVDPATRTRHAIGDDIDATLTRIEDDGAALGGTDALRRIGASVQADAIDANWLRQQHHASQSLPEVVWRQAGRWRDGEPESLAA